MAEIKPPFGKPGYSLTRRAFWLSFVFSWIVIVLLVGGALAGIAEASSIAAITIPSMVGLIAALLGIHRFAGSLDMRTAATDDIISGTGGDA